MGYSRDKDIEQMMADGLTYDEASAFAIPDSNEPEFPGESPVESTDEEADNKLLKELEEPLSVIDDEHNKFTERTEYRTVASPDPEAASLRLMKAGDSAVEALAARLASGKNPLPGPAAQAAARHEIGKYLSDKYGDYNSDTVDPGDPWHAFITKSVSYPIETGERPSQKSKTKEKMKLQEEFSGDFGNKADIFGTMDMTSEQADASGVGGDTIEDSTVLSEMFDVPVEGFKTALLAAPANVENAYRKLTGSEGRGELDEYAGLSGILRPFEELGDVYDVATTGKVVKKADRPDVSPVLGAAGTAGAILQWAIRPASEEFADAAVAVEDDDDDDEIDAVTETLKPLDFKHLYADESPKIASTSPTQAITMARSGPTQAITMARSDMVNRLRQDDAPPQLTVEAFKKHQATDPDVASNNNLAMVVAAIDRGDDAKAQELLNNMTFGGMTDSMRATFMPSSEQAKKSYSNLREMRADYGGELFDKYVGKPLSSAMTTRSIEDPDKYVANWLGKAYTLSGMGVDLLYESTGQDLAQASVRSLLGPLNVPLNAAASAGFEPAQKAVKIIDEETNLPTPAGIEAMRFSDTLGPIMKDAFGLGEAYRTRSQDSTAIGRVLANAALGEQGPSLSYPAVYLSSGGSPEDIGYSVAKAFGAGAELLDPVTDGGVLALGKGLKGVVQGAHAASMAPSGMRIRWGSDGLWSSLAPSSYARIKGIKDADFATVIGNLTDTTAREMAARGEDFRILFPKEKRAEIAGVVSGVTDPVKAEEAFLKQLADNRATYDEVAVKLIADGTPELKAIRASTPYAKISSELDSAVKAGAITDRQKVIFLATAEAEASRLHAAGKIPSAQSFFDAVTLHYGGEEAPPVGAKLQVDDTPLMLNTGFPEPANGTLVPPPAGETLVPIEALSEADKAKALAPPGVSDVDQYFKTKVKASASPTKSPKFRERGSIDLRIPAWEMHEGAKRAVTVEEVMDSIGVSDESPLVESVSKITDPDGGEYFIVNFGPYTTLDEASDIGATWLGRGYGDETAKYTAYERSGQGRQLKFLTINDDGTIQPHVAQIAVPDAVTDDFINSIVGFIKRKSPESEVYFDAATRQIHVEPVGNHGAMIAQILAERIDDKVKSGIVDVPENFVVESGGLVRPYYTDDIIITGGKREAGVADSKPGISRDGLGEDQAGDQGGLVQDVQGIGTGVGSHVEDLRGVGGGNDPTHDVVLSSSPGGVGHGLPDRKAGRKAIREKLKQILERGPISDPSKFPYLQFIKQISNKGLDLREAALRDNAIASAITDGPIESVGKVKSPVGETDPTVRMENGVDKLLRRLFQGDESGNVRGWFDVRAKEKSASKLNESATGAKEGSAVKPKETGRFRFIGRAPRKTPASVVDATVKSAETIRKRIKSTSGSLNALRRVESTAPTSGRTGRNYMPVKNLTAGTLDEIKKIIHDPTPAESAAINAVGEFIDIDHGGMFKAGFLDAQLRDAMAGELEVLIEGMTRRAEAVEAGKATASKAISAKQEVQSVVNYLYSKSGSDVGLTAAEIAEATGVPLAKVDKILDGLKLKNKVSVEFDAGAAPDPDFGHGGDVVDQPTVDAAESATPSIGDVNASIRVLSSGNFGTFMHELAHYVVYIEGDLAEGAMKVFDSREGRLTPLGEEQIADAMAYWYATGVAPNGLVKSAFARAEAKIRNIYARVRGNPTFLAEATPDQLAFLDGMLKPEKSVRGKATQMVIDISDRGLYETGGKGIPKVSRESTLADLDVKKSDFDGKVPQANVVDVWATAASEVMANAAASRGVNKLIHLGPRTVVPEARVARIRSEVNARLGNAGVSRSSLVVSPEGMIEFSDSQAAGFRVLVAEVADRADAYDVPQDLVSHLADDSNEAYKSIPAEDYNRIVDLYAESRAGIASRSTVYTEGAQPDVIRSVVAAASRGGLESAAPKVAQIAKEFYDSKLANAAKTMAPAASAIIRDALAKIGGMRKSILEAVDQARKGDARAAIASVMTDFGYVVTAPTKPGMSITVRVLRDKMVNGVDLADAVSKSLPEAGVKATADGAATLDKAIVEFSNHLEKVYSNESMLNLQGFFNWNDQMSDAERSAFKIINEVVSRRLPDGSVSALTDAEVASTASAIQVLIDGTNYRVDLMTERGRLLIEGILGDRAKGVIEGVSHRPRGVDGLFVGAYEAFYNPVADIEGGAIDKNGSFWSLVDYVNTEASGLDAMKLGRGPLSSSSVIVDPNAAAVNLVVTLRSATIINEAAEKLTSAGLSVIASHAAKTPIEGINQTRWAGMVQTQVNHILLGNDTIASGGNAAAYQQAMSILTNWGIPVGDWKVQTIRVGREQVLIPDFIIGEVSKTVERLTGGKTVVPASAFARGAKDAMQWILSYNPATLARIKLGMTVGYILRAGHLVGNFLGNAVQVGQVAEVTSGLKYALRAGPEALATKVAAKGMGKPPFVGRVLSELNGGAWTGKAPAPIITKDLRVITPEMVINKIREYGLDTSYLSTLTTGAILHDLEKHHPGSMNKLRNDADFLNRAGEKILPVNNRRIDVGRWYEGVVSDVVTHIDSYYRVSLFVDEVTAGASWADAAETAKRAIFEYSDISNYEKRTVRSLVLFYSFLRKSNDLFWWTLVNHPNRVLAQLRVSRGIWEQQLQEENLEPEIALSDWQKLRLGGAEKRDRSWDYEATYPDPNLKNSTSLMVLPAIGSIAYLETIMGVVQAASAMSGDEGDGQYGYGSEIQVGELNPYIQWAFVAAYGLNPTTGAPMAKSSAARIPDYIMNMDAALGGRLQRLFNAQEVAAYAPERSGRTGPDASSEWVATGKSGLFWWFTVRYMIQTPISGSAIDFYETLDRSDSGIMETVVNLTRASGEALGLSVEPPSRPMGYEAEAPRPNVDLGFIPVYPDQTGPRLGLGEPGRFSWREFMPLVTGVKTYPVLSNEALLEKLRMQRAAQLEAIGRGERGMTVDYAKNPLPEQVPVTSP